MRLTSTHKGSYKWHAHLNTKHKVRHAAAISLHKYKLTQRSDKSNPTKWGMHNPNPHFNRSSTNPATAAAAAILTPPSAPSQPSFEPTTPRNLSNRNPCQHSVKTAQFVVVRLTPCVPFSKLMFRTCKSLLKTLSSLITSVPHTWPACRLGAHTSS
jgi:hypothetical protein